MSWAVPLWQASLAVLKLVQREPVVVTLATKAALVAQAAAMTALAESVATSMAMAMVKAILEQRLHLQEVAWPASQQPHQSVEASLGASGDTARIHISPETQDVSMFPDAQGVESAHRGQVARLSLLGKRGM